MLQAHRVFFWAMNDRGESAGRKRFAGTNLVRKVSYIHEDKVVRSTSGARKEHTSKFELIRRALRVYLGIED